MIRPAEFLLEQITTRPVTAHIGGKKSSPFLFGGISAKKP
jgi:hypothetical protein